MKTIIVLLSVMAISADCRVLRDPTLEGIRQEVESIEELMPIVGAAEDVEKEMHREEVQVMNKSNKTEELVIAGPGLKQQ